MRLRPRTRLRDAVVAASAAQARSSRENPTLVVYHLRNERKLMKTILVRGRKPHLHISAVDWLVITVAAAAGWITLCALGYSAYHLLRKLF